MSASPLVRASSSRLRPLRGAFRGDRSLHSTELLLRRGPPTVGPRTSLRASTRSSSSSQEDASTSSRPSDRYTETSSVSSPAATLSHTGPSTSTTPVSGTPRHHQAKVEVLPFRVSTKAAREYLTTLATLEVMPRIMSRWSMIKHQVLSLFGFRSMSNADSDIVKLVRMTALYLPTWIVDASFEVKCRGNNGRAEANFITMSSRLPGHSWKPMDTMPMLPPAPYDMNLAQGYPSFAASPPRAAWDNLAMVDYASYTSHQERKADTEVKITGGIPDPLPFTISPLQLPEMLRKQLDEKDLTFAPDLAKHKHGLTIALVNQKGEQLTSPPLRFEPHTLKLDMMAAYPILMPLHMAEFSYKDEEDVKHYITMVLGAWDSNGSQFCLKESDQDWQYSFDRILPFQMDTFDLYPGAPIKTSINEAFERARQEERAAQRKKLAQEADEDEDADGKPRRRRKTRKEWEEEWEREDAEYQRTFRKALQSRIMEKLNSELPIKAAVEERSLELLERADWIHWEREEREAFETRTSATNPSGKLFTAAENKRYLATLASARNNPTEPHPYKWLRDKADRDAEREHPDRKAGLGRYIYWSSPHVQRLSHNVYANRRYLKEAIPQVLESRKNMASIAESGYDVDRSHIKAKLDDGRKVSGEEAYNTIAVNDLNVRQRREALKPRWLKALEEAGNRR